jgi:hypothetical protein
MYKHYSQSRGAEGTKDWTCELGTSRMVKLLNRWIVKLYGVGYKAHGSHSLTVFKLSILTTETQRTQRAFCYTHQVFFFDRAFPMGLIGVYYVSHCSYSIKEKLQSLRDIYSLQLSNFILCYVINFLSNIISGTNVFIHFLWIGNRYKQSEDY